MSRTLPGRPVKWKPTGLSDALDGTQTFPGAMSALVNLIPSPNMRESWVPRPASALLTSFAGFTSPAQINVVYAAGNIVYGMIAETSGAFSGKDVPFAYNVLTNTFQTIAIPGGAASLPTTPSNSGDWTPPTMDTIGSYVIITHPGYPGGSGPFFGWLDISGFTSSTITGNTHTSKTIDTLSTNVLLAGWLPGMIITDLAGDLPANTTIVSIAVGGLSLTISNAATGSNATTFTVAGGTATAPVYGSGNTNIHPLTAVPVSAKNFNGRAYFAVPGNGLQFSDALVPLSITNASQGLNPGNGLNFTALAGLPVQQTLGGVLQALIAFQGDSGAYQVTGDPATNNLALNEMGTGAGTLAPNTLSTTPNGLAFVAPDGLRFIEFSGQISEVIGANGSGLSVPFLNAINPTRMCADFNQNTLRISVKNGNVGGQPVQEYWYDFGLKTWSGPHSFPAAVIVAFQGTIDHGFILMASGINAELWSSSTTPKASDSYVENGATLTWSYRTILLPDDSEMSMSKIVQMTLSAAVGSDQPINVSAFDEFNVAIDQITLMGATNTSSIWGSFVWGVGVWGSALPVFYQHPLSWNFPLIFKQASFLVNGASKTGTLLGNLNMQIESLGYLTQQTG